MNCIPFVVVRGWPDVQAALAPGLPVALLSGPGAACHAGVGWWCALMRMARGASRHPVQDVLDCADSAGRTIEALRAGCRALVLDPAAPAWADLAWRAESVGAALLSARPAALDLAERGAARHLEAWLRDSRAPFG